MELPLLAPVTEWQLTVRLGVALLVGTILGFDREIRGKSAGLRTYMLVCFGSAIFVLTPIQLGIFHYSADAFSRVIQGIITGIGFVGGGVILHRSSDRSGEDSVKGLTSAVAIWVATALGTAAACGLWQIALGGAVVTLFILRVIKQVIET